MTGTPDVLHLGTAAQVTFHRAALASPGGPLPRSAGTCPLRWSEGDRPVVVAPLAHGDAVWLSLRSEEPVALQVFVDGINAVTGSGADTPERPVQQHLFLPDQRWLDGIRTGEDRAAQVTGPAEGERRVIRLIARRLGGSAFRSWWQASGQVRRANRFGDPEPVTGGAKAEPDAIVTQRIEPDPFRSGDWDPEPFDEVEIQLVDPRRWAEAFDTRPAPD